MRLVKKFQTPDGPITNNLDEIDYSPYAEWLMKLEKYRDEDKIPLGIGRSSNINTTDFEDNEYLKDLNNSFKTITGKNIYDHSLYGKYLLGSSYLSPYEYKSLEDKDFRNKVIETYTPMLHKYLRSKALHSLPAVSSDRTFEQYMDYNSPKVQELTNNYVSDELGVAHVLYRTPEEKLLKNDKMETMESIYKEAADEGLRFAIGYFGSAGFKERLKNKMSSDQAAIYNANKGWDIIDYNKYNYTDESNSDAIGLNNRMINQVNLDRWKKEKLRMGDWSYYEDKKFDALPFLSSFNLALNPYLVAAHESAHRNNPYDKLGLKMLSDEEKSKFQGGYDEKYGRDLLFKKSMPEDWFNLLKNGKGGTNNDHDNKVFERYSDLISTRANLLKYGIFDSRSKGLVFTKEMYENYAKLLKPGLDRFFDTFSKKDFIKAINEIAMNNKSTTGDLFDFNDNVFNTAYAKLGIKIKKRF